MGLFGAITSQGTTRQLRLEDLKRALELLRTGKVGKCGDIPSEYRCPITLELMEDPVFIDTRTYERTELEKWIATQVADNRAPSDPVTREVFSETDVWKMNVNQALKSLIDSLLEKRAKELLQEEEDGTMRGGEGTVKYLADLGEMFSKLDSPNLRELLYETLGDWEPPKIVVIGSESSGKSSVLERLMMTPLLPTDRQMCTRLPIHIHLRFSEKSYAPKLEVCDISAGDKGEKNTYTVTAEAGQEDVSREMKKIPQRD